MAATSSIAATLESKREDLGINVVVQEKSWLVGGFYRINLLGWGCDRHLAAHQRSGGEGGQGGTANLKVRVEMYVIYHLAGEFFLVVICPSCSK